MMTIAAVLLAAAGALFAVRLVIGPSVADRVVAVDSLILVVIAAIAVGAAPGQAHRFIDAAVVIGLLGFVGTSVAARFVERRGG